MSKSCQPLIRSLSVRFSLGHRIDWHTHDWSQLLYASEGAVSVSTKDRESVIPPFQAIWVPANLSHKVEMHGRVFLRTLYVHPKLGVGAHEGAVRVSALMHELILHCCSIGILRDDLTSSQNLIRFVIDQLVALAPAPFEVTMPGDPRAYKMAAAILKTPSASLERLASQSGASVRTLQRLFRQETGYSLGQFRHRVMMLEAVRLLAANRIINDVAMQLGYESTSAFIQAFRKCYGITPGQFSKLGTAMVDRSEKDDPY